MMDEKKFMNNDHLTAQQPHSGTIGVLRLVLAALIVMIFVVALAIVQQTQERHETYIQLQKLSHELNVLKTEEQRLMIEQQTFSATPQVAQRAVTELGMFFPTNDSRRVIMPNVKPSDVSKPSE
ncbi:cell division protein FtsL [Moraxella sp. ZJ142]|uniref:cell division protein FtsL n=1 Tax=Moraxella marmotae TaxID=3344520 RepID=UPI0035D4E26B